MAYGYIGGPLYDYRFDTWQLYKESLIETDLLLRDPKAFVVSLFQYGGGQAFFSLSTGMNFINNFQFNFHYKVVAIFNLFSGRNYYVNTIFFSFFTFYGLVCFIRLVRHYFPDPARLLLLAAVLLPGFAFWGNGMYKEGWVFTGIAACLYGAERFHDGARYGWLLLAGFFLLLVTRMFTVLMFTPFLLYYLSWKKWRFVQRPLPLFLALLGILLLLASWLGWYHLPADIAGKRSEFLLLKGESLLDARALEATWQSVLAYVPRALGNTLLRPFPWEVAGKPVYLPSALEIILLEMVFLYWIVKKGWRISVPVPFQLMFAFAFLNFIVIGWTVPFLGAIVRYRSIYLPFVVVPLIFAAFEKKINKIPAPRVK
ncbi:MAG: hypothetical protein ACO1NW_05470 [Chitinophagaceae bacterium]